MLRRKEVAEYAKRVCEAVDLLVSEALALKSVTERAQVYLRDSSGHADACASQGTHDMANACTRVIRAEASFNALLMLLADEEG